MTWQAISYATSLAKLSPVAGLFSSAIPGLVYSLLGSSRQLNVGTHHLSLRYSSAWNIPILNLCLVAPEAALALLVGQAVQDILVHPTDDADGLLSTLGKNHPEKLAAAIATIITFQVGADLVLEYPTAYFVPYQIALSRRV